MAIPTRKIGNDVVPTIGLGHMGVSIHYGAIESDEDRFKVLDAALEEGCTFWDTADVYGDSEGLIGNWSKRTGKRDKIFLATKFGNTPTSVPNGKPEYVRSACELSLKRLGVDTIGLYYIHRIDQTVPIEAEGKSATLVYLRPAPPPCVARKQVSRQYIKENMEAAKLKLSPEEVAEARKIANDADATDGDRYPTALMSTLFADTPTLA